MPADDTTEVRLTTREFLMLYELAKTGSREHGAWDPAQSHLGLNAQAVGIEDIVGPVFERHPEVIKTMEAIYG